MSLPPVALGVERAGDTQAEYQAMVEDDTYITKVICATATTS
jgi:hypothetical protein